MVLARVSERAFADRDDWPHQTFIILVCSQEPWLVVLFGRDHVADGWILRRGFHRHDAFVGGSESDGSRDPYGAC